MNKNKILITAIIGILLASSVAFAIESAAAMPFGIASLSSRPVSASWVRLNGIVTQWGTTDARGQIQTQARTALLNNSDTRQLASASAIWTTNLTRPIQAVRSRENFTYVFYAARLMNASVSTLNTGSSSNYVIGGTWTVATVNATITVITNDDGSIAKVNRNQDITTQKAYGELTVTDSWTKFTLAVTGLDPLTGTVYRSITRQMQFNPFKITDDSVSNVVTRSDIRAVGQAYGSMPGWGSYDTRMDFNNNYRVDIADISSVARNI